VARGSISEATEIAYYLSNAPLTTPLHTLATVAAQGYSVEECIEEGKGETGLDDYEVRFWHSWQRHITLSMMAHAWLAAIGNTTAVKKGSRFRTRRGKGPRSAPLVGDCVTLTSALAQGSTGVVALARRQTAASASESLSPA